MILLSQQLTQWLIIVGAIFFFLIPFILNKKIKVPEGTQLPEKCHSCAIDSCFVKTNLAEEDTQTIKEKLRNQIAKCEEENEEN